MMLRIAIRLRMDPLVVSTPPRCRDGSIDSVRAFNANRPAALHYNVGRAARPSVLLLCHRPATVK